MCMHITQRKRSQGKTEFGIRFLDARSAETIPLKLASPDVSQIWFDTATNTDEKKMVRCMWTSYSKHWKKDFKYSEIRNSQTRIRSIAFILEASRRDLKSVKMRMDWSFSCNPGTFRWILCCTETDEFRDDSLHMERIHLSRGSSTRPILYCCSWIGRRRKGTKRRTANNFLHSSWSFQQRCQRSRVHYRFNKARKLHYQIHWRPEQDAVYWVHLRSAQNAGLEFWHTGSNAIVTHRPVPKECVVKVVSEIEKREIVRQTTHASRRTKSNTQGKMGS